MITIYEMTSFLIIKFISTIQNWFSHHFSCDISFSYEFPVFFFFSFSKTKLMPLHEMSSTKMLSNWILTIQFNRSICFAQWILCHTFICPKIRDVNRYNSQFHCNFINIFKYFRYVLVACGMRRNKTIISTKFEWNKKLNKDSIWKWYTRLRNEFKYGFQCVTCNRNRNCAISFYCKRIIIWYFCCMEFCKKSKIANAL